MNAEAMQIVATTATQGLADFRRNVEPIEQLIRPRANQGAIGWRVDQMFDQRVNARRWDRRARHVTSPAGSETARQPHRSRRSARSSPSGRNEERYIPSCSRTARGNDTRAP